MKKNLSILDEEEPIKEPETSPVPVEPEPTTPPIH